MIHRPSNKNVISRIQNRRGSLENLPSPLRPGEVALTSDSRQVWIGNEDVPPYGVRTLEEAISVSLDVNPFIENNIVSVVFDTPLSEQLFEDLSTFFARENNNIFPPFVVGDDSVFYNVTRQLLWDENRSVLFGLRDAELNLAATIDPNWLSDPAQAMEDLLGTFNGGAGFPIPFVVNRVVDEFDSAWQGVPGQIRFRNFVNPALTTIASGNVARLINLTSSIDDSLRLSVTTISNIELNLIGIFGTGAALPDSIFASTINALLPDTSGTLQTVVPSIEFSTDVSDTLFIEYSLNGTDYNGTGTLIVTYNGTDSNFHDTRTTLNKVGSGDINLYVNVINGNFVVQYENQLNPPTPDVVIKMVVRRWNSELEP